MHERTFKIATTSFIFPDHIIPNIKKLGPFFDEIELLIFESQPEHVLPSPEQVDELLSLSIDHNLTYNIHLPVDISLSSGSPDATKKAEQTLLEVLTLFKPLQATTHTLHLETPSHVKGEACNDQEIQNWKETLGHTLDAFLAKVDDPAKISIETLDYPFSLIQDLIYDRNLPVCIDIGHAIKYGYDWMNIYEKFKQATPLVHLHGVDFSTETRKDHTSLDKLPKESFKQIQTILESFEGVVSLEVFNLEDLNRSLSALSGLFCNIPPTIK